MPRARRRRLARQRRKWGVQAHHKPMRFVAYGYSRKQVRELAAEFGRANDTFTVLPPGFDVRIIGAKLSRQDRRRLARVAQRSATR
jgi:hypothetical protein